MSHISAWLAEISIAATGVLSTQGWLHVTMQGAVIEYILGTRGFSKDQLKENNFC